MEKFKLSNGLQVINAGYSKDYAACLGFSIGDMNEPQPGLAYLFVRILMLQKSGFLVYYGGVSTAFCLSGEDLDEILEKLYDVTTVEITEEYLEQAKAEIRQLIVGSEITIQQEMRFLFRRLVVGSEAATLDTALLEHIASYGVDDVKAFMNKYYTAANAVLLISAPDTVFFTLRSTAEKLFGQMNSGENQGGFCKKNYCGGYRHINVFDGVNRLMLGWDLSKFSTEGNSTVEVMLRAFAKELGQAYLRASMFDVVLDMRLVSYFGVCFMRVMVYSEHVDLYALSDVICNEAKKMCLEDYNGQLFLNRTNFVSDDLSGISELVEDKLFEIFDRVTGQIETPTYVDNGDVTTGEDIKLTAQRFFLGSELTCVSSSAPNGDAGLEHRLKAFFEDLKKQI